MWLNYCVYKKASLFLSPIETADQDFSKSVNLGVQNYIFKSRICIKALIPNVSK